MVASPANAAQIAYDRAGKTSRLIIDPVLAMPAQVINVAQVIIRTSSARSPSPLPGSWQGRS